MPIQLSGLAGFDSGTVITQLVQIAQQPIRDIDAKKTQVDAATTTLNAFSSKLSTLKSAAQALSTTTGMASMSATAADNMIVPSVTGSGVSSSASYAVEVTQLARAQKTLSEPRASATTALGQSGDLTINGVAVSIVSTDTLADIATKIGKSGARVSAGLVNAGGGYRLSLQGLDTGAAKALTFQESGTVSLNLQTIETARDAVLKVDGLDVTRPTNQIEEAIPGVKLALTKTGTTTVSIAPDPSALKTKLQAFVTAYNDVVNSGHTAAGYGSTKAQNAVLAADMGVRRSLDRLALGVQTKAISQLGLTASKDGVLTFDAAALDKLTDPAGAMTAMKALTTTIDGLITGEGAPLKGRIDSLTAQSKRLSESRTKKQDRVVQYEDQLRKQYARLDQAMAKYQSMGSALSGLSSG